MSINLGNVPSYLLTPHTIAAIQLLQSKQISITGTSIPFDYNTIRFQTTLKELVDAVFNTSELRLAQYTCVELYNYGFTLIQLRQGNYTAYELNHFLSVSGEQLYYLGYSISDLETIGYYLKSYVTTTTPWRVKT